MRPRIAAGVSGLVKMASVIALLAVGAMSRADDDDRSRPKNVFILVSDGCGYNHMLAADYYTAGKTRVQKYQKFPVKYACSTYSCYSSYDPDLAWASFDWVKSGATDSAAAATALSTGVKTYDAAIGVDAGGSDVKHIMERAEEVGKATGVVTSVQLSHATPAGFVAHNVSRNNYEQIADEMLEQSAIDVVIGCGHPFYDDAGVAQGSAINYKYVGGKGTWDALTDADGDGAGLVGADADGDGADDEWTFVDDAQEFDALATGSAPKRLCGVARVHTTLQQARTGDASAAPYAVARNAGSPTLTQLALAAINVLDAGDDGFVLMVEGGAVDWAAHANQTGRLIEEQIEFNNMVDAVCEWVKENGGFDENLVIVTADHETGYLCGPGSAAAGTFREIEKTGEGKVPGVEWNSTNHTNQLVPFFAKGAGASLFRKYVVDKDPVRGKYVDNTSVAEVVFSLLE